jgi:uroporphyrinogen decarboxylase
MNVTTSSAHPLPVDRVHAALRHEETERVPYNFMLSPPAVRKLEEYLGAVCVDAWVGSHLYLFGCSDKPLYAHPERYGPTINDQWGVVWATSEIDRGYPLVHPLRHLANLTDYRWPDPLEPRRWEPVPERAAQHPELFHVAVVGDLWERANFLCGLDQLLLELVDRPQFVEELLDRIMAYILATLERLMQYQPHAIFLSDDYGMQRSLMMSPADWRHFIKPRLAQIFAAARRHGCRTMLHSCGHVTEIVPDLIEIGLDILHPIQPEAMDIIGLKQAFGQDLTFCGGVNTQQLLPTGTPEQIRAEVCRLATEMGRGGGYILEPGITVQGDVPLTNLVAVIEAAKSFRRN